MDSAPKSLRGTACANTGPQAAARVVREPYSRNRRRVVGWEIPGSEIPESGAPGSDTIESDILLEPLRSRTVFPAFCHDFDVRCCRGRTAGELRAAERRRTGRRRTAPILNGSTPRQSRTGRLQCLSARSFTHRKRHAPIAHVSHLAAPSLDANGVLVGSGTGRGANALTHASTRYNRRRKCERSSPCRYRSDSSTMQARCSRPDTIAFRRWNGSILDDILRLIREERYFVLHAPRQTGKTSALLGPLQDLLNKTGEYPCVYVNVEPAQTARGDVRRGMRAVLSQLRISARFVFPDAPLAGLVAGALEESGADGALCEVLARWSASRPTAAGVVHRRDRLADRRYADFRAPAIEVGISPASGGVSAERNSVRGAGCARLPHSFGFDAGDHHRRAAHSTSRRSRCGWATLTRRTCARCSASTLRRRARYSPRKRWRAVVAADAGPTVAGERTGIPGVLQRQGPGGTARGRLPKRQCWKRRKS